MTRLVSLQLSCPIRLTVNFDIRFVSDIAEEEIPVPIPNTAVKLFVVDGTVVARLWESRTLLALIKK